MDERDTLCSQQYIFKVKEALDEESFREFICVLSSAKDMKSADVSVQLFRSTALV